MRIQGPILEAEFLRRINRFTAEVRVEGREVKAHLPNPSRLEELFKPMARLLLTPSSSPARRTGYSIFGVYDGDRLVGVDSRFPNILFAEAVEDGRLPEFRGYHVSKREVVFGGGRIDFLLERPGDRALVEVKSCSLVRDGVALFPDVPTERGLRHILRLIDAVKAGYKAYVVWVVQRPDARYLRPYREVQPEIEEALGDALSHGVGLLAYTSELRGAEMEIVGRIPVKVQREAGSHVARVAGFLHEALGLDPAVATLYCNLLARGSMSRREMEVQGSQASESILEMGLAVIHPSHADLMIPLHPRMAVTNLIRALGVKPSRRDAERAYALLSSLYSEP